MLQLPRVGWRLLDCKNGASPDCIIVVVVGVGVVVGVVVGVFFQDGSSEEMSMSAKSCAGWHGEPSMTKNSSSSRAPKTGAQLLYSPEEREKCEKPRKVPPAAMKTAITSLFMRVWVTPNSHVLTRSGRVT